MRHTLFSLARQYSEVLIFGAANPDPRARHLLTTPEGAETNEQRRSNYVYQSCGLRNYTDRTSFEAALDALRAAGFRNSDVSAILPERDRTTKDLAHEINTKAPEGAAAGAGTGAAVGGVLGWLVGIGALAIPGVGPLVAAGPIVAALAGAGAGGATGDLVGGLIGAGIPEVEAKRYAGAFARAGT